MSRPLDFIIFGVARSGTKGLARAFNLHPHLFCSRERFYFRTDHSTLTFPESFLDPSTLPDGANLKKLSTVREELAEKQNVRIVGNKLPRYLFALDRLNREVPGLKNVWIYRSPSGFIPSWNRREAESWKGQWAAGQIGLFGVMELFVCIENCLALPKDVFVFPYDPGLSRSDAIVREAVAFLGADPKIYDGEAFDQTQRRKKMKQQLRASNGSGFRSGGSEAELLDAIRVKELDQILNQGRGLMLSEIADPLRDYLDRITPILPCALDAAFAASENPNVASFGREYVRRYRGELEVFLERAGRSTALAGFQDYGVYHRLKSLYVRRWQLKRRLMAMRP